MPASASPIPIRTIERTSPTLRYWVRDLGSSDARALAGDPATAAATPMTKLVLNAISTFVVFIVAGLAITATAPTLFGYGSVVVVSGSMEPSIKVADVVLTAPSDGLDLASGTVIDFDQNGESVLHRIEEVTDGGYRTAGDANPTVDTDVVAPGQVDGVGTVVVPFVGLPRLWVAHGQWLRLGATLAVLSAALYMSRSAWLDDGVAGLATEAQP